MEGSLSLAIPGSGEFDEYSKLSNDYARKIRVNYYVSIAEGEEKHEHEHEHEHEHDDHHVFIEEDHEFTFACTDLEESPISAEEAFQDGQFRQVYPVFDQSLLYVDSSNSEISSSPPRPRLKKLFVEEHDHDSSWETDDAAGPYCEWSRKVVEASSSSQGSCKKSNSTGFSKIWRFRELVHRSSSDGKDAFVFFKAADPANSDDKKAADPASTNISSDDKVETKENDKAETKRGTGGGKGKKTIRTTSAHELHYVKNREMREEGRRRSYLPYRQGIVGVGFFTSVNGFTKNVHPY